MEGGRGESASHINLLRISACCDLLAEYVRTGSKNDVVLFSNLCLSLAREISYAISNKVIPERAHELPLLFTKVYELKNDAYSHAAILLLMISIKNACENKWFLDQESEVLLKLANEILSSFSSTMNFNTEPSSYISTISIIMSRYYPKLKMGKILAFLEVKPGYETRIHDFLISTDTKINPEERASLIVAQLDNTETSSCLISPVQANFLLNGIGVYGRNNVRMNTRPQMPTQIFDLLKYGVNLLQVVGEFKGNYMVVVAFMSMGPTPDHLELQDYVQSKINLDSELIEGPSRISLNCPISLKRIKVAVKGHMCKHSQCFDYESYLEINSIKPSWCCPLCNQHVCFTDIRIDQSMAKVIKEVDHTVNNVIIYSNGSWKAIMEDESCPGPAEFYDFSSGPADIRTEVGPTRGVLTLTPTLLQRSTMNSRNIGLKAQSQTFSQRAPLLTRANMGPLPGLTRQYTPLSHTNQGCSQTVITQQQVNLRCNDSEHGEAPPIKIKKAMSGLACYLHVVGSVRKYEYKPEERQVKFLKDMSVEYNSLPKDEKRVYELMAERDTARYLAEKNALNKAKKRGISTRSSINRLTHINDNLTDEQKEAVRRVGFGSMLHVDLGNLRHPIAMWMAERFDADTNTFDLHGVKYSFSADDVEQLIGLRNKGKPVVLMDSSDPEYVDALSCFGSSDVINYNTLASKIDEFRSGDASFVRAYILNFIAYFLCPNTDSGVKRVYLQPLKNVEAISEFNWAQHVFITLRESLIKYNIRRKILDTPESDKKPKTVYFRGCLYLLTLIFLDHINSPKKFKREHEETPSVVYWTANKVTAKIKNLGEGFRTKEGCNVLPKMPFSRSRKERVASVKGMNLTVEKMNKELARAFDFMVNRDA